MHSAVVEGLNPELRDLNTLLAALQIERYETSAYETLSFLTQQMGHRDAARLLRETLREEQETAKLVLELLQASKLHWTEGMAEDATSEAPSRLASPANQACRRGATRPAKPPRIRPFGKAGSPPMP